MKYIYVSILILTSFNLYSQYYTLEYQEKRIIKIPDRVRDNPLILEKVKEIVEEKSNTIFLTKVHVSPSCVYSRIDSIYYEKNFTNKHNIQTDYNIIEYYKKENSIYIKDPRFGVSTFQIKPDQIEIREYSDISKKVGSYNCHKMEVIYMSEKFELWVSDETKVKGGPIVFSFLPYLIVEAYSDKTSYRLISISDRLEKTKQCPDQFEKIQSYKGYEKKINTQKY